MKKKGNRKVAVAELLKTTSLAASPPDESPKPSIFTRAASTGKRATASLTKFPPQKALGNMSDLKDLASTRLDELKRLIDRSQSEFLKDLEASQSRLHKRFKMHTQTCQQIMDEAEKDYKKTSERITESQEAMKDSYEEFMADAQATASRACKTSITELSDSFEKSIDCLRKHFGISST
ncbi:hypothetical protein L6164_020365 [Bauhinia variegata]|uniref:Uncharacterized protein n=1 Tax=Bauhinia variegata TaxID=167791 RepID=A0ACB9MWF4_BAUVA|nr:hypothetical protein L6164_020365 [Bauhinia variegata]